MNRIECSTCGDTIEVTGNTVVFPYECSSCLDGVTEEYPYNLGVPCQTALDSVQADV